LESPLLHVTMKLAFNAAAVGFVVAVYFFPEYELANVRRIHGLQLHEFRILERISQGANGVVYEAEDTRLRRAVALKILKTRPDAQEKRRRLFAKEMRVLSALSHSNICKVHTTIEVNAQPVMVMELLVGEPLSEHLPWNGSRKDLLQLLQWFYEAADGLAYAHAQGVAHGDIHPQNLFITASGLKIVDFGFCHVMNPAIGDGAAEISDLLMVGMTMRHVIDGVRPGNLLDPEAMRLLRGVIDRAARKGGQPEYSNAAELRDDLAGCLQRFATRGWFLRRYSNESLTAETPVPWTNRNGVL
jgi:serine/threonine protein kinase